WYRARAAGLVVALRAAGPDAPAWTLWGNRVAAFWARRQLHETAIHAYDLSESLAAGAGEPAQWSVADGIALDGLSEVLTGFYPRQVRLGRTPGLPGVVRFEVRTDRGEPLAALAAPALGAADDGGIPAELGTVVGTASELYLAVWGRGPYPGASAELAEATRAARLTP
ncbi:MAG: maleylpyruvate isomerase family mycothiol-dependent enzyme, partial [Sinomonas sp.]|nr:maleylpyruvate isomerase family mycothiol-dependent enzyme [Sinomonas sp.]